MTGTLQKGGIALAFDIGITVFVFAATMLVVLWRPNGLNEAIPAGIGAALIMATGIVSLADIAEIMQKISGASLTIISTIVMAVVLENFGFFHWAAAKLAKLAAGSGLRLFWYIQLLCFLMTLLFNNDGSILITTPILILLLKNLRLKPHQFIPYLLSGALIATASSAPIGVSNIVNLIAMDIVGMSLLDFTKMMFVPALLGLLFMSCLMFIVLKSKMPKQLPPVTYDIEEAFFTKNLHPLKKGTPVEAKRKRTLFMGKILLFVLLIRCLLFVASYFSIPIEIISIIGSLILLAYRWRVFKIKPFDVLKKTPWSIFVFAFSMYVIIYGLHNAGLTKLLIAICEPIMEWGLFEASLIMGGTVSLLSNIFNNHPALMVGTMSIVEMDLDPVMMKTIYLAAIIGSDIGALLLPIGTLASLLWMDILKRNKIKVEWKQYIGVTFIVIPLTTLVTLLFLIYWVRLVFL